MLIWTISRLFGFNLKTLSKGMSALSAHSDFERRTNLFLILSINIEEVLLHNSLHTLFKKLKESGHIAQNNVEEWRNTLVENYKRKYKKDNVWDKARFNLKNNLLWKNDKIDFNDSIYHELFIPYEYTDDFEEDKSFITPKIKIGINIRVFLVNGIVKLQVGDFSKDYTPEVIRDSGIPVYKTHETITYFPLMYFSNQFPLPEAYLNLSAYATESWKNHYSEEKGKKKDMIADWKSLNSELRDYNFVCGLGDDYSMTEYKKFEKIIRSFEGKKDQWLAKEEFKDPFKRNDDDSYYYDSGPTYHNYSNKYMAVSFIDYNEMKEKREKYVYTDYYEENPL